LTFFVTAQDAPSPPAANAGDRVLAEVEAQRQILDHVSRVLDQLPVAEGLRKLDAANAKHQESLQTISALSENIRKVENLVDQIPRRVVEAEESTSKQGDFQASLTSQLTSLQTLVKNQQSSLDDLRSKLATISEHTKGLEQLTKVQKSSAKQTELLEKKF